MRTLNPARVPVKTLREAERVATAILSKAGVDIAWIECSAAEPSRNPCLPDDLGPNEFWLHLLPDKPPRLHGDAMGFAVLMPQSERAVSYAGVAWPAIEEGAAGLQAEVSTLLGVTIAHEIGHLLLGSKAHTRSGVMCPRFQRAEMRMAETGELRFTREQTQRIRSGLMRRAPPGRFRERQ